MKTTPRTFSSRGGLALPSRRSRPCRQHATTTTRRVGPWTTIAARAQREAKAGATSETKVAETASDSPPSKLSESTTAATTTTTATTATSSRVYKLQPKSTASGARTSKENRKNRKDVKTRKLEVMQERRTYRFLAISSSLLMIGLASGATWVRFFITDMGESGGLSLGDFYGTLFCTLGAAVGMEFYARYAHRILWHENEAGWSLHESHHLPRTGPFEANDIYAVANAVPALSLCIYGFLHPGLGAAMCWGTGLGITLYGWMYMFVHDGLVHKRFPVGPLAELPSLKRIAVAHTIHHSEKFGGVPYGLFLAEDELSKVEGGVQELDLLVERANAKDKANAN